ncbi:hypothetical protein ACP70R_006940 [Stipagrostis hirtigluma subsp. patula]
MTAPAASALLPPTGWHPLPWRSPAPASGQRRPPLLKRLQIAKQPAGLSRFAPAGLRKCAAASDHGRQELGADLAASLRGLVAFLAEQPRQLKHLEWPSFQNTVLPLAVDIVVQGLKTATLTLVLVAMFIVALSTVDAALCYVLAWLLRKSA